MATNINRPGSGIPRQYDRKMPENPSNYRPGITGKKDITAPPNTRSTYRQRNEPVAHQAPNRTPFVGTNPANLHLAPVENASHELQRARSPSLVVEPDEDSDHLDDLLHRPRSPGLTGDEQDLDILQIDNNGPLEKLSFDDDLLHHKESDPSFKEKSGTGLEDDVGSDDELLLEQSLKRPKQKRRKNLQDMLGDFQPPKNWGDSEAVGDDFNKGLFDRVPGDRADPNAIDPRLVGRAEIGVPDAKASTGLRAAGGAAAGAAIGTATGAAVGATFGGTVLASVAIGAGIGAFGFGIGAAVGAGVGLVVGIGLGIAYGTASAKRAKADYLDTSQQGTVQRASGHGVTRMLMPKQLGRRLLRAVKPSSRSWLGRLWNLASGRCKGGKKIQMEDRGRNARASEARRDLRYAVASDVAYSMGGSAQENARFSNNASAGKFHDTNKAPGWVKDYLTPIDALTDDQVSKLVKGAVGYPPDPGKNPNKYEAYMKDRQAYDRQVYTSVHKNAVRLQSSAARTNAAFEKNDGVAPWDFKTIGPNATPGSKAHEIFKRLPASLQQSLTDGQGVFRDPDTGNNVRIMYDNANDEVVIAYNGTGGGTAAAFGAGNGLENAQNRTNYGNYLGGTPPSVKQAVAIGKAVREAVQKYNDDNHTDIKVVSTGHSRGGLLATADAIKNKGKAVTFNPEAMGSGVRDYCGIYSNDRVPDDVGITVYSTRNDLASGKGWASGIGTTAELALGWLPVPVIGVPPVVIGDRRILPQTPGFDKHPEQVMHMTNLAGGAQPPPKARMRRGSEVDRGSLYIPEPDQPQPRSSRDLFKENVTYLGTTQGQMSLVGHPIMRKHGVKSQHLDLGEFERDLANAAELILSTRPGDIDPDDTDLLNQALDIAIGLNLQRQRGGGDNAGGGNDLQIAKSRNVEEEEPLEQRFTELVISAADDEELLKKVMKTPTMQTKNFDLDSMDRNTFRKNLAKYAKIFATGVKSYRDIEPQAITAIQTAINKTMNES